VLRKPDVVAPIRHHLNEQDAALNDMRNNIDAWWPYVESGAEAILMTASGCGVTVKEYGHLLAHDEAYAEKAQHLLALTRDLSEVLPAFETELVADYRANSNSASSGIRLVLCSMVSKSAAKSKAY
jgi:glycolate oxidase iron-sulfur subunit